MKTNFIDAVTILKCTSIFPGNIWDKIHMSCFRIIQMCFASIPLMSTKQLQRLFAFGKINDQFVKLQYVSAVFKEVVNKAGCYSSQELFYLLQNIHNYQKEKLIFRYFGKESMKFLIDSKLEDKIHYLSRFQQDFIYDFMRQNNFSYMPLLKSLNLAQQPENMSLGTIHRLFTTLFQLDRMTHSLMKTCT